MITNFFINLGPAIANWFLAFLPTSIPSWLLGIASYTSVVLSYIQRYSIWYPGNVLGPVAIGLFSWWVLVFLVKLGLKLWGFVPQFGGTG